MTTPRPLAAVPTPPARRTRWTDADLMREEFPPPKWAVPGLLAEGVNLLAGAPKLGKSWLSLGLGADIANGDNALGSIEVERGPVLYCALEDTGRRLQRRRRQQIAAGGSPAKLLTLETACPTMTAGGEQVLREWLDANPTARLVIIDTFEKMRGAVIPGISAYSGDYAAGARFKALADEYSVPFLLIHHVRKQGADDWQNLVSGTAGLTGAMDATLVLERGRGQADGVLHVTGRDVEEADYAMTFDAHAGAWTKLDGPATDHLVADTRATILRLLRDHGPLTPKAIADALELNPSTVRQTCKRMADDGQLHKATNGEYSAPGSSPRGDTPALSHLSPLSLPGSDQHKQV
ncbi:AAA family ATPase [Amycolatopsis rhabdoformis]|uniref:AAA family ATPase n=1 Tax=Amycolatopsis rhabdoformis TaxID=1448059 RepID=A0ABZ1I1X3_9PSEU|nr:AAA family ATPase [Amycolatopsis rhabdoformis]WSE28387.1 AAA family ATPase [Amycolatopsis rhabdoformis]